MVVKCVIFNIWEGIWRVVFIIIPIVERVDLLTEIYRSILLHVSSIDDLLIELIYANRGIPVRGVGGIEGKWWGCMYVDGIL